MGVETHFTTWKTIQRVSNPIIRPMLIKPEEVRGKTLYNMGTAYAEMERYQDAVKCFEQAIPRGLSKDEIKRTKDQIRRCNILIKEQKKKKR